MKWKKTSSCAIALVLLSCGATAPKPEAVPPLLSEPPSQYDSNVDPKIARIFAETPLTGRLPGGLTWSPDSAVLAFTRKVTPPDGEAYTELWLYDMKEARERPLVADKELSVSSFCWSGSGRIVFSSAGDLYAVDLQGQRRRLTETDSDEESHAVSPDNTRVAFVRDHNLFALEIDTGKEQQITVSGTEEKSFGEVTWVYGEEFRTEAGFGWSADGKKLWLYSTDESAVAHRAVVMDAQGKTRRQAYPRAGETNPSVRLGVFDFEAPKKADITWLDTGAETDVYLPQVTWHPSGEHLLVARLDRLQTVLELLRCNAKTGQCAAILAERDPRWVNLLSEPKFDEEGKRFLWLSERDDFSHIYQFESDGTPVGQITRGEWVVTSIYGIDEQDGSVYFRANAEKPTAYGIYKAALENGEIARISTAPGTHRAIFSPDLKHFIDTHSALDRAPRTELFDVSGEAVSTIASQDLIPYEQPDVTSEIFPIQTEDGLTLMANLTRPAVLEPNRRYPVLVYVYGGLHAQVVRDSFNDTGQPWRDLLASRGVLVFALDGRGSGGRGHEFECTVHRRLGEVELADQLLGVAFLKEQPYVDLDRIGIFGWSYGGFMVLNALLRTDDVFKAGVSVAPVTDWNEYDTAYTERYMQRPTDNPEGYAETSLLGAAEELTEKLLLVHGLADDNVHFTNSALMMNALMEAGKRFEVMLYPGKSHGIRGASARADLYDRITRFFQENL